MASQITSLKIVYSTIYSGADQRKHQSSASLAFDRWPVNSPRKGPVTRKMFPFDDVVMIHVYYKIRILISTSQLTDWYHLTTHEKAWYDTLKYWRQDSVDLWDISCFLRHDLYKRHTCTFGLYKQHLIYRQNTCASVCSRLVVCTFWCATIVIGGNQNVATGTSNSIIETVSAGGRSHGQRNWAFTPSGGGDMEIQNACLMYNLVTCSVCLRHN